MPRIRRELTKPKQEKPVPLPPKCRPKQVCLDLRKEYGNSVFPVCPIFRYLIGPKIRQRPDTDASLSALQSIRDILVVLGGLAEWRPSPATIVLFAHNKHFLNALADIDDDLSSLPQLLEKDYPTTSNKVRDLADQLKGAVFVYEANCGYLAYILPPRDEKYSRPLEFLQWQGVELDRAQYRKGMKGRMEMAQLTNTYPAEIIQIASKIYNKLKVPEKLLLEQSAKTDAEQRTSKAAKRPGKHPISDIEEDVHQYIISRLPYLYELTPGLLADDKEACKKFKKTFSLKVISREIGRPESKVCKTPSYVDYVKLLTGWHGRPRKAPKGYDALKDVRPELKGMLDELDEDEQ